MSDTDERDAKGTPTDGVLVGCRNARDRRLRCWLTAALQRRETNVGGGTFSGWQDVEGACDSFESDGRDVEYQAILSPAGLCGALESERARAEKAERERDEARAELAIARREAQGAFLAIGKGGFAEADISEGIASAVRGALAALVGERDKARQDREKARLDLSLAQGSLACAKADCERARRIVDTIRPVVEKVCGMPQTPGNDPYVWECLRELFAAARALSWARRDGA